MMNMECVKLGSFLDNIASNEISKSLEKVFNDKFAMKVLPRGARLPFSEFVGVQDNLTIVVSRCPPPVELEDSDVNTSLTEFDENEVDRKVSSGQANPATLLLEDLVVVEYVHVGQSISPQSVTLSSSHPLTNRRQSDHVYSEPIADISTLTPLTLDEARYIASLYSLCSKTSPLSLWIVCSNENRNIIALGTAFVDSTLFHYTISHKDTLPMDSKKNSFKSASCFSGQVFSQYLIASSSETIDSESGSIFAEFYWSEGDHTLCLPPESAHAIVKVSAVPGFAFSPVLATYNEVWRLLELCEILTGSSEWPLEESPTQETPMPLSEKIESFLSDVATPFTKVLDTTVISPTSESTIYEARKDLDFVERLWLFAKDVKSFADLKEVFAAVFKALLLGQVQPFVHRSSSSTIAKLLRQLLQCASIEDRQALTPKFQSLLSDSKLVSTLVQIGLDKMKRDYQTFFISSDIATDNQLEEFFVSSSSQSQLAQCHCLCKLHCVLELSASLVSFLNFPSSVLSTLTKTALQVYREMPFKSFSTTPTFCLSLPPHSSSLKSLISLCSKLQPAIWKAQLDQEQGMIVYRNIPLFGERKEADMYYVYVGKSDIHNLC